MTPAALLAALTGDLKNAVAASTPGGIERQEAEGQQALVASQNLPISGPRAELEALGFVYGEKADDLFVKVAFPAGYKIEASDHSMWSYLVNPEGQQIASIFYKAAFYDRRAFMQMKAAK